MAMDVLFTMLLAVVIAVGACVALDVVAVVIPLYLLMYVVQNLWKPSSCRVEEVGSLAAGERDISVTTFGAQLAG